MPPVAFRIINDRDREVEMKISRSGIACFADIANHLTLLHKLTSRDTVGVVLQVCIVIDQLSIGVLSATEEEVAAAVEPCIEPLNIQS